MDRDNFDPAPFEPSEWQRYPDGGGNMWTRPNPTLTDIRHIFEYALTFDGYEYAKAHFALECGDLANARAAVFQTTGQWPGTFEELRCCLFFEQRRWRHFGEEPTGDNLQKLRALHTAICARWDVEWPVRNRG
jgi:hypothetical protein